MDESTQKRAINSLIDLWEDANFVLGKGSQARKLKPYLQAALSEPGSIIHRLIEAALKGFQENITRHFSTPEEIEWFDEYTLLVVRKVE